MAAHSGTRGVEVSRVLIRIIGIRTLLAGKCTVALGVGQGRSPIVFGPVLAAGGFAGGMCARGKGGLEDRLARKWFGGRLTWGVRIFCEFATDCGGEGRMRGESQG